MTSVSAGWGNRVGPKRSYARIAEQTWIWSVVGYTILRFVIAWGAFSDHGANVWVFGLIDIGTAWPYAKGVALICKRAANAEYKRLFVPMLVSVAAFFAPYGYLWFAAGEMPAGVRIGLVICVSVLLLAATTGVVLKTRKLRGETNDETGPAAQAIIDLTSAEAKRDQVAETGQTSEPRS